MNARERAGAMACIGCIGAFRRQKQNARVQPEPDAADALFKVVLDCQGDEPFGLILAGASSMRGLVIVSIKSSSAASRWNTTGLNALELGQAVVEVNGVTNAKDMLREFRRVRQVELMINPEPDELQISVFKASLKHQQKSRAIDLLLQEVTAPAPLETCSICHDDMDARRRLEVRLPCGHRFHQRCVKDWFLRRLRCPLCNHDLGQDVCEDL